MFDLALIFFQYLYHSEYMTQLNYQSDAINVNITTALTHKLTLQ